MERNLPPSTYPRFFCAYLVTVLVVRHTEFHPLRTFETTWFTTTCIDLGTYHLPTLTRWNLVDSCMIAGCTCHAHPCLGGGFSPTWDLVSSLLLLQFSLFTTTLLLVSFPHLLVSDSHPTILWVSSFPILYTFPYTCTHRFPGPYCYLVMDSSTLYYLVYTFYHDSLPWYSGLQFTTYVVAQPSDQFSLLPHWDFQFPPLHFWFFPMWNLLVLRWLLLTIPIWTALYTPLDLLLKFYRPRTIVPPTAIPTLVDLEKVHITYCSNACLCFHSFYLHAGSMDGREGGHCPHSYWFDSCLPLDCPS